MSNTTDKTSIASLNIYDWKTHAIDPSKKTAEWGADLFLSSRNLMRPIYGGWYNGQNSYDATLIRQFAEGNQPIERYKVDFDPQDKQAMYMGMNWDIAPIIPQIRQRILADLNKIPASISCNAIDPLANQKKLNDKKLLMIQPILDRKLAQLSKKMGLERPIKSEFDKQVLRKPLGGEGMPNVDIDFENEAELDMLMNSEYYSMDIEIAQEITQKAIFDYNQFDEMSKLLKEDAIDFGMSTHRLYIDNFTGMPKMQYMYPYKCFIMWSKFKDYHDANMWYYRPAATLVDVLEQFGHLLTIEDVKMIWDKASHRQATDYPSYGLYGFDWRRWNMADLRKVEIDMYYFEVKSPDVITYEESKTKTGKPKIKRKPNDYEVDGEDKKKQVYWAECVYKGYYIEGINKVYDWGKLLNMPREQGREQFTPFSLIINRYSEKGLTENVIAYADTYQEAYLKMKYAIIKSLPRGYSFNWDALAEVTYGDGGNLKKEDLIKMYLQTGSTIHKTRDEMGDPLPLTNNGSQPHMLMENGIDPSVEWYLHIMNQMSDKIALTMGVNPTADALAPPPRLGAQVSERAAIASSNARHFLYSGFQQVVIKTANYVSLMLNDIAKYNPQTWDRIKSMVGSINTGVIESIDDMPLYRYGFFFRDEPTDQELMQLQQDTAMALQQGKIDFSDYLSIRFVKNYKMAVQFLNLKMRKREKQAMQMQQGAMQLESQKFQMEMQAKMALVEQQGKNSQQTAEITGKYNLLATQMKEQADLQKKLIQEISKLNLVKEEQAHEQSMAEKEKAIA